ncbi:MAG TPA: tripartite tricarboxylate transporter TctB family protein [Thermodesulfobacteriota bacterium]|nr:tripartite tricarboxylate transporter TctB family protein [Thermodesulfobacteriota bacterium]
MRTAEQIACLFWIAVSLSICAGAVGVKLGTPSDPGPGFLPFGAGALLGILALAHLLKTSSAARKATRPPGQEVKRGRSVSLAVAVFVYALVLPHLGYLIATFILMVVLFSIYDRRRWIVAIPASIAVIAVTYVVFHMWLKVQFPSGYFGIG